MDLSIIIINWNSSRFLRKCLDSIYSNVCGIDFEIIVLDNASYDGCGGMLAREYPAVLFIQSDRNLGFARGNNLAAARAKGDIFLFLNPDTEILQDALQELLEVFRSFPDAGTAGAMLLNSDGTIQTSCVQTLPTIPNQLLDADLLRRAFPKAGLWGTATLFDGAQTPQRVEAVSGACLMTPRSVFYEAGGFTEDYFMYYEDMDYCLKVSESGRNNYFVPGAVVTHHGGKSAGDSRFSAVMMAESASRFFQMRRGAGYARLFRFGLATKAASRFALLALSALITPGSMHALRLPAILKWKYVLRWCMGAERWVAGYPGTRF